MSGFEPTIASDNLALLIGFAAMLGFLHTALGPDHYVPFVMLSRAQRWSRAKTLRVTLWCGLGHVASSIVIGIVLGVAGMAFSQWEHSAWAGWHEGWGRVSAWLLVGVGAAFCVWGIVRALRRREHSHVHAHADGTVHVHPHDHNGAHMHAHDARARSVTPWVLFTLFVFGPCESLIPLMLAGWGIGGFGASLGVALVFSAATVVTIVGIVALLLAGVNRIPLGPMERWSTAIAGLSLVLCGLGIAYAGL
jgi:ABC-type nickel/cobalt efflux system permease component RcnA